MSYLKAEDAKKMMLSFRGKKRVLWTELTDDQKYKILVSRALTSVRSSASGGCHYVDVPIDICVQKRVVHSLQELGYEVSIFRDASPIRMMLRITWGTR